MKLEKLKKQLLNIDSNITAFEKDDCIFLSGEVDDYTKVVKAGQKALLPTGRSMEHLRK